MTDDNDVFDNNRLDRAYESLYREIKRKEDWEKALREYYDRKKSTNQKIDSNLQNMIDSIDKVDSNLQKVIDNLDK